MRLSRDEAVAQGYLFETLNKHECRITKFRAFRNIKRLEVPQFIGSLLVTEIGENVFTGQGIQELILPNGLLVIHSKAFSHCKLKQVTLPDTIIEVAEDAFASNPITKVVVPQNYCLPQRLEEHYNVEIKTSNFNLIGFLDTRASKSIFEQNFKHRVFFKLPEFKTYVARASILVALSTNCETYYTSIYQVDKEGNLVKTNREDNVFNLIRVLLYQTLGEL